MSKASAYSLLSMARAARRRNLNTEFSISESSLVERTRSDTSLQSRGERSAKPFKSRGKPSDEFSKLEAMSKRSLCELEVVAFENVWEGNATIRTAGEFPEIQSTQRRKFARVVRRDILGRDFITQTRPRKCHEDCRNSVPSLPLSDDSRFPVEQCEVCSQLTASARCHVSRCS